MSQTIERKPMKLNELKELLEEHDIPTHLWGRGDAKTVGHLFGEIESGETVLETTNGHLLRRTSFLSIEVFYTDETGTYKLVEDKQVFSDGRVRRRHDQAGSVKEKLQAGETDVLRAATRALHEELGISGPVQWLTGVKRKETTQESPSYPGLTAQFTILSVQACLTASQYKAEGYKEVQPDKTTFFVWKRVTC